MQRGDKAQGTGSAGPTPPGQRSNSTLNVTESNQQFDSAADLNITCGSQRDSLDTLFLLFLTRDL